MTESASADFSQLVEIIRNVRKMLWNGDIAPEAATALVEAEGSALLAINAHMPGLSWVEGEWDGTLVRGLAQRADLDPSNLALFEKAKGRTDLEVAVDELVEALGGAVEYTEPTGGAPEAHLIVARVHLRLREAAWELVVQTAALAIALFVHNPGGLVNALQLVRAVIDQVTILSPAERDAVRLIGENQRRGATTPRDDVGPFGVDVDSLIARGVVAEGESGLSVRG